MHGAFGSRELFPCFDWNQLNRFQYWIIKGESLKEYVMHANVVLYGKLEC